MMRVLGLIAVLVLTGCGDSPEALGLTGPKPPIRAVGPTDELIDNPGPPGAGENFAPKSRYFNYN